MSPRRWASSSAGSPPLASRGWAPGKPRTRRLCGRAHRHSVAGCPSHLPSPLAQPAPHLRTLARFPRQGPGAAQPRRGGCPSAPRPPPRCTGPRAGAEAISDTVTVTPRRPPWGPEPPGPLRGGLGPLAPCVRGVPLPRDGVRRGAMAQPRPPPLLSSFARSHHHVSIAHVTAAHPLSSLLFSLPSFAFA